MDFFSFFSSPAFTSGLLHNALFLPLALTILDFFTGVASAIRRGVFDVDQFANILGKDSMALKWAVGAFILFVANGFNHFNLDLNVALGVPGSLVLSIPLIKSIVTNIIELFPKRAQPYLQVVEQAVEQEAGTALGGMPQPPVVPAPLSVAQQDTQTGLQALQQVK